MGRDARGDRKRSRPRPQTAQIGPLNKPHHSNPPYKRQRRGGGEKKQTRATRLRKKSKPEFGQKCRGKGTK